MTENDIRLYGITKNYGPFCALKSIDLKIAAGEFLTLLGPSGSGKSTLLMALAGFVEPSDGNIFIGNRSIISLAPEKRDFGVVFQGYALFPHMTVEENLAYPLKVRRMQREDIARKVEQTLELVQLTHLAKRHPKQLSGGQQQRVALARALVFSPNTLLLDEPMGALDKNLRHDLQLELRQLHRRLGRTFVNVTHDQEEAMAMSDRIAIMRNGEIVQIGDPRTLYEAPKTKFVAAFLGKSNFLQGQISGIDNDVATIQTSSGVVEHLLRNSEDIGKVGSEVLLALRPQKLTIGMGPNCRRVKVESAVFQGTHADLHLRCDTGSALSAQVPLDASNSMPAEGDTLDVTWSRTATTLVQLD